MKFDKNRWYIIFSWYCHWSPDYYLSISLVGNNLIESGMDYKWIWSAWNGSVHTRLKKTVDSSNGDDKRSSCLSNAFLFIAEKKNVGSRVPVLFSMLRFRRALLFNYRCSFLYIYVQQNLWFEPVNCFKAIFCFGHRVSQARFGSFFFLWPAFFFLFHQ